MREIFNIRGIFLLVLFQVLIKSLQEYEEIHNTSNYLFHISFYVRKNG